MEQKSFCLREASRSCANLLKLGVPMTLAGAGLVAAAFSIGSDPRYGRFGGGLNPAMAPFLVWAAILGGVGVVALLMRLARGGPERYFRAQVARFGDSAQVLAAIDAEAAESLLDTKKMAMTARWAIVKRAFSTVVFPFKDLMWLYRSEVQHYVNGIKGGKEISLMFHLRSGGAVKAKMSNVKAAVQLTEGAATRAPWAVAGYNMLLDEYWKTNRAQWIKETDERRTNPPPAAEPAVGSESNGSSSAAAPAAPTTGAASQPAASQAAASKPESLDELALRGLSASEGTRESKVGLVFGLGLGSLFIPLPIGIVAAVIGFLELRDASQGKVERKPLTTVGIVLGIFGTLVQTAMFAVLMSRRRW